MPVQLTCAGDVVSLSNVKLEYPNRKFCSSTKSGTIGRWYYEYTHVEGDGFSVVGYSNTIGVIAFYPKGLMPDSTFVSNIETFGIQGHTPLGFTTVNSTSTIGLGLDMIEGKFYIRSSDEIKTISLNKTQLREKINLHIFEAEKNDAIDVISINLGASPFAYGLPPGFTAWENEMKIATKCAQKIFYGNIDLLLFANLLS